MVKKTDLIAELKRFSKSVSRKMRLNALILFGSRAEGRPRKYSDVDLVVVSPDFRGKSFGRTRELYSQWHLNLPVDFLCFTPEEFDERSKRLTIARVAMQRGIRIVP